MKNKDKYIKIIDELIVNYESDGAAGDRTCPFCIVYYEHEKDKECIKCPNSIPNDDVLGCVMLSSFPNGEEGCIENRVEVLKVWKEKLKVHKGKMTAKVGRQLQEDVHNELKI